MNKIAETRILQAIERGELDQLPGAGKRLELDDDSGVPAELRMAWRILKNAGFVPPEVSARREIADLQALIYESTDDHDSERVKQAAQRLALLMTELERSGRARLSIGDQYYSRIVESFVKTSDESAG